MITTCKICKTSYNLPRASGAVRCASCGATWTPVAKRMSLASKLALSVGAFLILLLTVFALSLHFERAEELAPLKLTLIEAAPNRTPTFSLRILIKNQTDSMLHIPKLNALVADGLGNTEIIGFHSPTPLLIGGESVEFEREISYTTKNPRTITVEFANRD